MAPEPAGFAEFWAAYPRRVGRLAAVKAYQKARTQASLEELLDGIARYIEHKPEYADYCHPSTFLSQGRWMDEYDEHPVRVRAGEWCQHTPRCHSPVWHEALVQKERAG